MCVIILYCLYVVFDCTGDNYYHISFIDIINLMIVGTHTTVVYEPHRHVVYCTKFYWKLTQWMKYIYYGLSDIGTCYIQWICYNILHVFMTNTGTGWECTALKYYGWSKNLHGLCCLAIIHGLKTLYMLTSRELNTKRLPNLCHTFVPVYQSVLGWVDPWLRAHTKLSLGPNYPRESLVSLCPVKFHSTIPSHLP